LSSFIVGICAQTRLFVSVQGTGCLPEIKNGKKWLSAADHDERKLIIDVCAYEAELS